MDFSDNNFGFSPIAMLKFGDDKDSMDWSEILTPRAKDTPHSRTRCVPPPQLEDEDSGLGMEFDDLKETKENIVNESSASPQTPMLKEFAQSYSIRRSLFEKSKRPVDGDDDGSITKKPGHSRRSTSTTNARRTLTKSISFGNQPLNGSTSDVIISAVERLVEKENMIGNGAKTYCLPTIPGKHPDLKSITPETMAEVLAGTYNDVISSYRIIDCRYPYEYNAGHIKGAENLYTRDQIQEVAQSRTNKDGGRDILIFHCEFSSERGPKIQKIQSWFSTNLCEQPAARHSSPRNRSLGMNDHFRVAAQLLDLGFRSRFLRSKDRELNSERYPFLNFPEVYLLHNGYEKFYEKHMALCEPMSYTPMLHENHAADLRHFRSKSKSWCAGVKTRRSQRLTF